MKLTCKQCGKEFELSESEIAFYKSKNLHIPKRCEQCRKANKKNKAAAAKPYENAQMQSRSYVPSKNSGSGNNGRNNKLLCAILIIAILLVTGGIILSHTDLLSGTTEPPYNKGVYTAGDVHNSSLVEPETFDNQSGTPDSQAESPDGHEAPDSQTESPDNQSETPDSQTETPNGQSETSDNQSESPDNQSGTPNNQVETVSDTTNDTPSNESGNSSDTVPEASGTDSQTAQADVVSTPQYKFRNSELLNEHFEKHGKEMGFATAEDYQAAASAVVLNPSALHKLEAEDGDDVYYIESSNDFVIVSTDGYIRTYFHPNNGIEYYNKQ